MYNTQIVCTYNTPEVFLESDAITDDEKDFIRDTLYRQELLDILGIEDFNETLMNIYIHELFEKIESCNELKECMAKVAGRVLSDDLELGLIILFSYDYMNFTHVCVSEYLETGQISKENMENLMIHL